MPFSYFLLLNYCSRLGGIIRLCRCMPPICRHLDINLTMERQSYNRDSEMAQTESHLNTSLPNLYRRCLGP